MSSSGADKGPNENGRLSESTLLTRSSAAASETSQMATGAPKSTSRTTRRSAKRMKSSSFRLPVELHALCLHSLVLRDRIMASHVSAHWRNVALGDPTLWNRLSPDDPNDEGLLEALINRSIELPFHLDWRQPPSDQVERLIMRCIHRLVTMTTKSSTWKPPLWTMVPAPNLEVAELELLRYSSERSVHVPRLRELRVVNIWGLTDDTPPIPSLRTLRYGYTQAMIRHIFPVEFEQVFKVFPLLEELALQAADNRTIPDQLPTSLRKVTVNFESNATVITEYLHSLTQWWVSSALEELRIFFPYFVPHALSFFTDKLGGSEWQLMVLKDRHLDLSIVSEHEQGVARKLYVRINVYSTGRLEELLKLLSPFIGTVRNVSTPSMTAGIYSTSVVLESLTSLTLEANAPEDWDAVFGTSTPVTIRAPVLRSFTLRSQTLPRVAQPRVARVMERIQELVHFDAERLDSFTIASDDTRQFDRCKWGPCSTLAREIRLEHPLSGEILRNIVL